MLSDFDWNKIFDECLDDADMELAVKLDSFGCAPTRAHADDAGLDLRSPYECVVKARESKVIDTGVHVALPQGTAGLLVSKSGLNVEHDITSTGLIDSGYTGSIKVKLHNHGADDYHVHRGDKVSQLVIFPVIIPNRMVLVEELDDTERGDDGFGSSGR